MTANDFMDQTQPPDMKTWQLRFSEEARVRLAERIKALEADNERLRGLIKQVEGAASSEFGTGAAHNCPWCFYAVGDWRRRHAPECLAFNEDGTVR